MKESVIYHIDVNSAFLSWEAVYRLKFLGAQTDLREIPSAVGGSIQHRHGIILAKSIPAKAYHIQTGESVPEALKKCPDLVLVPPNYNLYETCSHAFLEILKRYSPDVEQYSIDEVYVDMTETCHLFGGPVEAAHQIRNAVKEELGFTVNVGVSSNKLLAKMASDFQKPDRVHTLFPEEIPEKMWPLPVGDLFLAGRASTKKLQKLGIQTIGQLADADPEILKLHLKSHGRVLWDFANGRDLSFVQADPEPNKGYGNSTTVSFDVEDVRTAKIVLMALAETVGMRLRKDHVKVRLVSVAIKDNQFRYMSHQKNLSNPTNVTKEICQAACSLFEEVWDGTPIRHLGLHTGRVESEDAIRQLSLFDPVDYEKLERRDRALDAIRGKYGIDTMKRAVFLEQTKIDHLSGGISRERRSVDYEQCKIL